MHKLSFVVVLLSSIMLVSCEKKEVENNKRDVMYGVENGHQYVDLGLSVKWASCNVGATLPEFYGDYYAWGDTTSKSYYDWSTYRFCKGSYNTMSKYCVQSTYGTIDNKIVLDKIDDAASVNWGGSWRMPTHAEQEELFISCTITWTGDYNNSGIAGIIFKSKKEGYTDQYIFLPAAGYRFEANTNDTGSNGNYWSSSLDESVSGRACIMSFSPGYVGTIQTDSRRNGFSIRPVCQ